MHSLFIGIYGSLHRYPWLRRALLLCMVLVLCLFARSLQVTADLSQFLDIDSDGEARQEEGLSIFQNIDLKDRLVFMLQGKDSLTDRVDLLDAADSLQISLGELCEQGLLKRVMGSIEEEDLHQNLGLIYRQLPFYISDSVYSALSLALDSADYAERKVAQCAQTLSLPLALSFAGDVIASDPLELGFPYLRYLHQLNDTSRYTLADGFIFSKDQRILLLFAQPSAGMGVLKASERLTDSLEVITQRIEREWPVTLHCYGSPIVSAYNSKRVTADTMLTVLLAIGLILLLMFLFFRRLRTLPQLFFPVLFGAIFALGLVAIIQQHLSLMALGISAVVIGIALSYSIHVITHACYVQTPQQLLRDLAHPLTLGSITTIGAFAVLIFAKSPLLHDFGLLSSLWLVGTTLFCLVFSPHYLSYDNSCVESAPLLLRLMQGCTKFRRGHGWVVFVLMVFTLVSLFLFHRVRFTSDMRVWNYQPARISEAESLLDSIEGGSKGTVYLTTTAGSQDEVIGYYRALHSTLDSLQRKGEIVSYHDIEHFLFTSQEQQEALNKWTHFWEEGNRSEGLSRAIEQAASGWGFSAAANESLTSVIRADYTPVDYLMGDIITHSLLQDWIHHDTATGSLVLMSRIDVPSSRKATLYPQLMTLPGVSVVDREFFLRSIVESIHSDFNLLLWLSSLLVFAALLISYRRIELALMAFLPMALSWVLILGLMYILGLEFNIVNIILSTLIFGIGDDYSIFVMDGLLREYRDGSPLLEKHMSAIFLSALTVVIGVGVLIFARHPAIRSIALSAGLGIVVVVLISFVLTPFLFHRLITYQVRFGGWPFTWPTLLFTILFLPLFLAVNLFCLLYGLVLTAVGCSSVRKRKLVYRMVRRVFRILFAMSPIRVELGRGVDSLRDGKPKLYIANHQSYLDIPLLLCYLDPLVIVTNRRMANSPFRKILEWLNFPSVSSGYRDLEYVLRRSVEEGYSVLIFPEGTRSSDLRIRRFHHGAFYLADRLELPITPLLIYGSGHALAKRQPFLVRESRVHLLRLELPPHFTADSSQTYATVARRWRAWYEDMYAEAHRAYASTADPFYRLSLMRGFAYKGVAVERAVQSEVKREGYYQFWHEVLPLKGTITCLGDTYGAMPQMMSALSPWRRMVAYLTEEEQLSVAGRVVVANARVSFLRESQRDAFIPVSDVIVLKDLFPKLQTIALEKVLIPCLSSLRQGGCFIAALSKSDSRAEIVKLAGSFGLNLQDERLHPLTLETILFFNRGDDEVQDISPAYV